MKKILGFFLVLFLIAGVAIYIWLHGITKKIFIPRIIDKSSAAVNSIQQSLDSKTPINILLVGYGGGNHDGPYLTDSMIAIHIDPKTQKTFLISIPRDIWIKIPTNGSDGSYSKINAAYSDGLDDTTYPNKQSQFMSGNDGGGRLAEYVVSVVTGLPINYFAGMDFSGFTHTIDTLGGVDIDVEPSFDDYEYPIDGQEDNLCGVDQSAIATISAQIATGSAQEADFFPCRFEHLHFDAGLQHMDGATALKYVRSRHSLQDGTDFGRAERQRKLLVAVKQKVFSLGLIPKILPFVSSLGDDARTDLTIDDVKTFIQNANVLNKYQIVSLALTDQNYLNDAVSSDGQDILESRDGIDDWTSVHKFLSDEFSGKVEPVAAIVEVENGTKTAGIAALATNKLKNANIQVVEPIASANRNTNATTITVFDKNVSSSDIATIKKEFPTAKVVYGTTNQADYNVEVIVGEDYNQK